jgi:hypothetical protein
MATVLASAIPGTTFAAKLTYAAALGTYPAGTVFDFSAMNGPQNIGTTPIDFSRPGRTFIFGAGSFTYSGSGNMFQISVPNITLIGTSRSPKDIDENGTTWVMNPPQVPNMEYGYHVYCKVTTTNPTINNPNSLTIKNINFKGNPSVYTSSGGTAAYSFYGYGGIIINEANPTSAGSNLNNVIIDNVLIDGAKTHGIFLFGSLACTISNTRVRNAAGHGFYLDGEATSTSFDTCYASGNKLAGFCLKDTAYSSLNNCASDSNGLGYWLRNTTSTTLVSCGAESNVPRSSIPNALGMQFARYQPGGGAPPYLVNDIGSDNVNHIKGTSFFISGGGKITLTSPLSKDPGGNPGTGVFINKRTAHFGFYGGVDGATITSPRISGTTTTKYNYRIEDLNGDVPHNLRIEAGISDYDPTNPTESPDGGMSFVADVLDQGYGNIFDYGGESNIFGGEAHRLVNSVDENINFNVLAATERIVIPTYPAHPATTFNGTIYFNSVDKKLYMYYNQWYDTCCTSTPPPDCVFPNGFSTYATIGNRSGVVAGTNLYSNNYNAQPTAAHLYSTELVSGNYITSDLSSTVGGTYLINMSSLTYSPVTNCLYWTTDPGVSAPTTLVKYDLTTQSVTATLNLGTPSSTIQGTPIIANGFLYVVFSNSIVKHNASTLQVISTFMHSGQSPVYNTSYAIMGSTRIIMGNGLAASAAFTVFDTQSEVFNTYSIPGATNTNYNTSIYLDSSNNVYVTSQNDGIISQFDSGFNFVNSWTDSTYIVNPSGLYINEVGSNVIATYGSTPVIPPGPAGTWNLVAYNLTTGAYIGSTSTFSAGPWSGPTYMVEISDQTFGFGASSFHTVCSPFAQ